MICLTAKAQVQPIVTEIVTVCDNCTPNSVTTTGNIIWTWTHNTSGMAEVYRSDQAAP